MTLKHELFTQIKIAKDGNCLFRSLVIFLNENLLKTRRNRLGLPTNTKYLEYEEGSSLFLRKSVVRRIETNQNKYSDKLFYDDELYDSIGDRIEHMNTSGIFAGKLEMDTIAEMNQIVICVLIHFNEEYSCIYRTDNETELELDVVDEDDDYSKSKYCFLLLEDSHYTLLEPNYQNIQQELSTRSKHTNIVTNDNDNDNDNDNGNDNTNTNTNDNGNDNTDCKKELICIESAYTDNENDNDNYYNDTYDPIVSDHSFLSNSNSSGLSISQVSSNSSLDKCFEQIERCDIVKSVTQDITRLIKTKKNGLLLTISHTPRLLEMRDSYKKLTIDELIDIIESVN